ncbi:MAG: glutamate racemase [Alphaproteobacteria bacterium CG_4_10_14_0_8_um_filter_53_9]|nr:MAG: glutamate racemase [Alphaproteobacteria bacterium CG_4_10_14_0_8_um_filter_53_9]
MIGVFDSGHGGLTVFSELTRRFGRYDWMYYGDHGHAPYGGRSGDEIVALTQDACAKLFMSGCKLVILACNTATAAAGRTLQQEWLPEVNKGRAGHKILGIIAPTVEAVTQTPWSIKTPVFPQKYNDDTIALFATKVTVESGVYETEIAKRCPRVRLVGQACPALVPLIERGAPKDELRAAVAAYVAEMMDKTPVMPEWAILGCTHYPHVQDLFAEALPPRVRILSQPRVVADALEDYLERHASLVGPRHGLIQYFTSGDPAEVARVAASMGCDVRWGRL